jgi:hypothetical protein
VSEKLAALELIRQGLTVRKVSSVTGISRKQLREWEKKKADLLLKSPSPTSNRLPGAGRKRKYAAVEEKVFDWVLERRRKKRVVSNASLKSKFQELQRGLGIQKRVTNGYIASFKEAFGLAYRKPTHTAQENCFKDAAQIHTIFSYLCRLNEAKDNYRPGRRYNMDESPFYYEMLEKMTLELIGSKSVDLLGTGADKSRFTAVITVRDDGYLLPIMVILKGILTIWKFRFPFLEIISLILDKQIIVKKYFFRKTFFW